MSVLLVVVVLVNDGSLTSSDHRLDCMDSMVNRWYLVEVSLRVFADQSFSDDLKLL